MKYWELKYWQRAKKVAAMSQEDKKSMIFQVPSLDVDIVPNGVDSKFFSEKISHKSKIPIILYLGNFTWLQNREAVEILINKVWPSIKKNILDAKLWIIGKDAKVFFAKLESENVRVDEVLDVRQVYQQASVLVAPIYGGGGTRYKNFEAFASGLPVVTTSIGIRGTKAVDGKDVIIRDKPDDISQAVINILKDKNKYEKVAENAKKMVKEEFSISDNAAKKNYM